MLYEMRVYDTVPGKMPDLLKRFETKTTAIWKKHGIRPVGFFTAMVGASNRLTYFVAWESLAEREQKWAAFVADPDWKAAVVESEKNGPLVARSTNEILTPTAFSAMK
jgi:hypothetical protein